MGVKEKPLVAFRLEQLGCEVPGREEIKNMNTLTKLNPFRSHTEVETLGPLVRWNPFHGTERMLREMDRLFDNGVGRFPGEEAMAIAAWTPSVDIIEDEKEFVIKAELPEVKKEDVKVTVDDGALTIRGER